MNIRGCFNELPVTSSRKLPTPTSIKMSLTNFGFTCWGVGRTKTGDNETKNKKAKYETAKMNTRSIAFRSFQQPWSNEFPWVWHASRAAHRDD